MDSSNSDSSDGSGIRQRMERERNRRREGHGSELASQLADVMVECRKELCMRKELMAELKQLSGQRDMEWTSRQQGQQGQQQQKEKEKKRNVVPVTASGGNDHESADEDDGVVVVVAPQDTCAKDKRDAKLGRYTRDTPIPHTVILSETEKWTEEVLECDKNRLAMLALSNNDVNSILKRPSTVIADTAPVFNVKIPIEGSPVTNQQRSGRCWLFASTNVFRVAVMKAYNLDSFQLSQAYLFFWDKLEKANYFLESILKTFDEPLDGRLLGALMASPVGDGGQWDMVANLVDKYGLVPHSIYPDQESARNSSNMDRLLTSKLRTEALRLRDIAQQGHHSSIKEAKRRIMQDVHRILVIMLGPPPAPDKQFTWTFYDKDGVSRTVKQTPCGFAKELSNPSTVRACNGTDVNSLFSLVNDPRNEYWQLLSVKWLGNVYEGRPIRYVNIPMEIMKKACIAMLHAGHPVFFGCDVGKSSESAHGIMDVDLFDYDLGFNVNINMNKCQRLSVHESQMTHAMVLTGVHVEEGKSVRWRVENSWSKAAGTDGYFVMTDKWMNEFVYQAVVAPSFVDADVRDVLLQKPKVLPLWDPMGALA